METVPIGAHVRQARERAGLSQRNLAPRCGVDRSTIQKLEAGKLAPSVALVDTIATALGVPSSVLGRPRPCRCGCGELTFAGWLQGHNPKAEGPVRARSDRRVRGDDGERLRQARIVAGQTLEQLGRRVGVSLCTLSSIENGHDLPSEKVVVALRKTLGVPDLFDLQPCPCGCGSRTVGGRFARGHHSQPPAVAATLRHLKLVDWATGGPTARGALDRENDDGRKHVSGDVRRRRKGRWSGSKPPEQGQNPRGNQPLAAEKVDAILEEKRRNPRLGVRPIAERVGVSKSAAASVLERYRAVQEVSAQGSEGVRQTVAV
ncbi:MAG: helix-turn-helix domain-containing protein [Gaiellaceae bacterium]